MDKLTINDRQLPRNLFEMAKNAQKGKEAKINELLTKRKWPKEGWSNDMIEYLVGQMANLDSNNYEHHYSLGEREGRVACDLVWKRHYRLTHGIGRSGDLSAAQPKAVGSTILANITESMVLDCLHFQGLRCCQRAAVIPVATGMSLTLCFLALRKKRPSAKYIIWSRIDQLSCFKSMTTAAFEPIVIDTIPITPTNNEEQDKEKYCGEGLVTDVLKFQNVLEEYKDRTEEILCIMSTSSCFAPRNCDNLEALAILAKKYNVPHVINNAYGLQSTYLTHQVQQAHRVGRVDFIVQSTDKNLLVPVGGTVVASSNKDAMDALLQTYAGRGAITPTLDVFMTLLSLGRKGYGKLVKERKEHFQCLLDKLKDFVNDYNCGTVIRTKGNPISIAISFNQLSHENIAKELGARLFTRGVTGARAIVPGTIKNIDNHIIQNWGCHTNSSIQHPYLTVAASIGITNRDVEHFLSKLKDCWLHLDTDATSKSNRQEK